MERSRRLRSRMRFCAVCASFQNCGDSDLTFSSSSRRTDLSQSKMPPQQGERLLDLFDGPFGLGAHGNTWSSGEDIRAYRLTRNTLNFQDFPNRLPRLARRVPCEAMRQSPQYPTISNK